MMLSELQLAAAKYSLGILSSWELPRIADRALNQGLYSPALAELATLCEPIMSDAGPLFEKATVELGMAIPPRASAIWLLLRHHIKGIAEAECAPRQGLHLLMKEVYYPGNLYEQSEHCVGDSHGIQALIGCFYSYDDLEERPTEFSKQANAVLDQKVIELAREWLHFHSA